MRSVSQNWKFNENNIKWIFWGKAQVNRQRLKHQTEIRETEEEKKSRNDEAGCLIHILWKR